MSRQRKTMGFKLPGMVAIDRNVSSGLKVSDGLKALLVFSTASFVKLQIKKDVIDGEGIAVDSPIRRPEDNLSQIRGLCPGTSGGFFVLFGFDDDNLKQKKCLMVTFIPEGMKVRSKMLYASSKGLIKKTIAVNNPETMIEEYHCTELKEISLEAYTKKKNVEKPFTEAEKQRMEEDKMATGGGEGFLAHIMKEEKKNQYGLPGFGLGMKPSEVKKDRIASMAIARQKDEERNQRVDFLLKLKEEKEKMEREMAEAAAGSGAESKKSDGERKPPPVMPRRRNAGESSLTPRAKAKSIEDPLKPTPGFARPLAATIDLNNVAEEPESDED